LAAIAHKKVLAFWGGKLGKGGGGRPGQDTGGEQGRLLVPGRMSAGKKNVLARPCSSSGKKIHRARQEARGEKEGTKRYKIARLLRRRKKERATCSSIGASRVYFLPLASPEKDSSTLVPRLRRGTWSLVARKGEGRKITFPGCWPHAKGPSFTSPPGPSIGKDVPRLGTGKGRGTYYSVRCNQERGSFKSAHPKKLRERGKRSRVLSLLENRKNETSCHDL